MNKKKLVSAILYVLIVVSLFSGGQAAPDTAVVVGKNDGRFEAALNSEATASGAETEAFSYSDKFTGTDGKIEFYIDVSDIEYSGNPMPVIRMTPEPLTVEKAKQISEVLFGDAKLYEDSGELSKSELEDQILYYRQISSYDYIAHELEGLNGERSKDEIEAAIQSHMEARLAILADLKEQYEDAPDDAERQECRWTFYPASHYALPGLELTENEDKTKQINAITEIEGVQYLYWVNSRDAEDFRNHSINAFFDDRRLQEKIDAGIVEKLYHAEEPDEDQVEAVRRQVADMIERMDIGEWEITYCETSYHKDREGYQIAIEATPVYNGIAVTPQTQLANLKSEEEYASNYYYEQLSFRMGTEGELISFSYYGPLEVVDVVNENTAVMSFDELTDRIKAQLPMDDIGMYQVYETIPTEKVVMMILYMEFGLSRTKIRDNPDDFYLVPSVTLRGSYLMYNESSELIETGMEGVEQTLLVLNLVDGSVIHYAQ